MQPAPSTLFLLFTETLKSQATKLHVQAGAYLYVWKDVVENLEENHLSCGFFNS